jgi:hypothetical protein
MNELDIELEGANCLSNKISEEKLSFVETVTAIKQYEALLIKKMEKLADAKRCASSTSIK